MRKLLLLFTVAIVFIGCKDVYGACAKASDDIADTITQADKTILQLQQMGELTQAEALNVAGYFEFVNKANEGFQSCIATAHSGGNKPGTYTACAGIFNTTLNNPQETALIHVSDAKASATITGIVDTVQTAVTAIQSQLGGA